MEFTEEIIKLKKQPNFILDQEYVDIISDLVYKISTTRGSTTYSKECVVRLDWTAVHTDYVAYADVTTELMLQWARGAVGNPTEVCKQMLLEEIAFSVNDSEKIVNLV